VTRLQRGGLCAPIFALVLCILVPSGYAEYTTGKQTEQATTEPPAQAQLCIGCHGGPNSVPSDPLAPILAGQEFYYLYVQLKDYKAGRRANPVMSGIVDALNKEDMQALAQYFSEQEWPTTGYRTPAEYETQAARSLAAGLCVQCHLGGYEGTSRTPRLAGQKVSYLERTMREFKKRARLNSPAKVSLLATYDDADIAAMAHYLGGL